MDSKLANVFVPGEIVEKDDPGARHDTRRARRLHAGLPR